MLKASCCIFAIFLCTKTLSASSLFEKLPQSLGSTPAAPNQFPFLVAIYFKLIMDGELWQAPLCTGSILNNRWIITAADCVYRVEEPNFFMVAGRQNFTESGTIYHIESIHVHPDFESIIGKYSFRGNVALMRTNESIQFNDQIQPIKLCTEEVTDDTAVQVIGWVRQII